MSIAYQTVFVKGMSTGRNYTFEDCRSDTTIDVFRQKVADRLGVLQESIRLVFGAKQLTVTRGHGTKQLTMGDFGIQNESTCHLLLRVVGGSGRGEGVELPAETNIFSDLKPGKDLGFGTATKDACECSDATATDWRYKLKGCGHKLCAECLQQRIKTVIEHNGGVLSCAVSGCGESIMFGKMSPYLKLTDEEEKTFERDLTEAFLTCNPEMGICPNTSCGQYVFNDRNSQCVRCPTCRKQDYCFMCLKKWIPSDYEGKCGNDNCDVVVFKNNCLENCDTKIIQHGSVVHEKVPSVRLCPKDGCEMIFSHGTNCKHVECPRDTCAHKFCFVCLKNKGSCPNSVKCDIADTQKATLYRY